MILHARSATFRYRAGRIVHISEPVDLPGGERLRPAAFVDDVKEFKTMKSARKHADGLQGTTFLQVAVVVWSSYEEAETRMHDLQREGVSLE